jgi:RimJ/RimL family protein N-acetyltransferase
MEWTVLDWNARAIKFYKRLGAGLRKEWILTRLTGSALDRLAQCRGKQYAATTKRSAKSRPTLFSDK